ncbi:MAG: endolytic transglycosylase MltG, partial [Armatimonadetes bacterium]|nr:endolytic transglycosylase MltG [Armatimonadota bacterium]
MTRLLVQLLLFLLFLGAAVGVFVYSSYLVEPVGGDGPPIRVDIPPGATATEIAVHLKKAGAIRSELAFR